MTEKDAQDNRNLIDFWDQVFVLSDEDKAEIRKGGVDGWRSMAPSEKLFVAASSLGSAKKVLDYGCGNAWAGIIAAKNGCTDVTSVDVAKGALDAAAFYTSLYDVSDSVKVCHVDQDWLKGVPAASYDGVFCSNVLDVVPEETAQDIVRELARVSSAGARVVIGLNFYMSPERAAEKSMELVGGTRLYVNGILRLVSLSDEKWTEVFSPYFTVEKLEHFAWPGEKTETRRLFYLKKK